MHRGVVLVSPPGEGPRVEIAIGTVFASAFGARYVAPLPSEWQHWLDAGWQWVDRRVPPSGWADWFAHGDQLH